MVPILDKQQMVIQVVEKAQQIHHLKHQEAEAAEAVVLLALARNPQEAEVVVAVVLLALARNLQEPEVAEAHDLGEWADNYYNYLLIILKEKKYEMSKL